MKKHIYILITVLLGCSTQTPSNINIDIKENNINNSANTNINSNINKQANKENSKKVSDVFILPDNIQLNLREKSKVIGSVKYEDKTSDNDFNLSVSGESIKIDEQGNITPLTIGKSTITLTSNQDKTKSRSINVNVNPIGKYLLKEDKNISNYLIESNSKDELILVWSITNNEYSTKIYIQRMDKNYNNTSDIIEINDFKNVDPNSLKVKLNNNSEILLAGVFNDKELLVFKIDNNNIINKKLISSNAYDINYHYSFEFLDNNNIYIIYNEIIQNSKRKVFAKAYDNNFNIIFNKDHEFNNLYVNTQNYIFSMSNKIYILFDFSYSPLKSLSIEMRKYNLDGVLEKNSIIEIPTYIYNLNILKNDENILVVSNSSKYSLYDLDFKEVLSKDTTSEGVIYADYINKNDIILPNLSKLNVKENKIESLTKLFNPEYYASRYTSLSGNFFYLTFMEKKNNSSQIYIQKFDKNFNLF